MTIPSTNAGLLVNGGDGIKKLNKGQWLLYTAAAGALVIALGWSSSASAEPIFDFSGSNEGGTGSATMEFFGIGSNSLTVELDNTSPTTLDESTDLNAPGITGFGFDGTPDFDQALDWTLFAFDLEGAPVQIGGEGFTGGVAGTNGEWVLGSSSTGNLSLEFLAETDGIPGALYNPMANVDAMGADPNYITTATLSVTFPEDVEFQLNAFDATPNGSPFVRMQNVGIGGEGSLSLTGTTDDDFGGGEQEIPVPATLGLLGFGLLATGVAMRRRRR